MEEIHRLLNTFDTVAISHVYSDINMIADSLPKDGLQFLQGHWHITKKKEKTQMLTTTGLLRKNKNYYIFEVSNQSNKTNSLTSNLPH